MNYDEILRKILRKYGIATGNIRTMQVIESKLKKRKATYSDAEKYAQEIGKALTDGRLFRAAAEVLVKEPMIAAGKDVGAVAAKIQKQLNENADIGLNAITPELNMDQIDGIITGICNAPGYEDYVERFMDQVGNFLEGHVDDCVRENAEFQSEVGLTVYVQRIADADCCRWCSNRAGTYEYNQVQDKASEVWRRHLNCHCQIIYDPQGSKRRVLPGARRSK